MPQPIDQLIAWRSWDFREDGFLHSVFQEFKWPVMEKAVASAPPTQYDNLGFHAFRSRKLWNVNEMPELCDGIPVWGQVSMWGQTMSHARGFRSEFAYPYSLFVREEDKIFIHPIRTRYCVDVGVAP